MTQENSELQKTLIRYIEDAYAMEAQIEEVLDKQLALTEDVPVVQTRIRQHLAETQLQKKRMGDRLEAYGRQPNVIKTAVGSVLGNLSGMAGALRPDTHSRLMRDDYVTEHLEIAAYTYLITTARLCGDTETARMAELTLREEIAMAQWLSQHLNDGLFKDFENAGLNLPPIQGLKTPRLTVAWEPLPSNVTTGTH